MISFFRGLFPLLVRSALFWNVLFWSMIFFLHPLRAQERGPVIIEAESEVEEGPEGKTGATTVVEPGENGIYSRSMADLLEREASVRVNRYGGRGAYQTLSLRGSNPNQVGFYIDGIPISDASEGAVNLSDWDPGGFRRIEIYRSGDWGSSIGGGVNLVPRKGGAGCDYGKVRVLAGSHKTAGGSVDLCGGEGLSYSLHTRGEVTDQNYIFHNDNGTPLINEMDDHDDRRKNVYNRELFNTLHMGGVLGDTQIGFLVDSAYRNHGVPGPVPGQSEKTERHLLRHTAGVTTDTKGLFADWFRLSTIVYGSESRTKFFDPLQEFASNQPNSHGKTRHSGLVLKPTLYLLSWHQTLRLYVSVERESCERDLRDKSERFLESLPLRRRHLSVARLEDEIAFWDERLIFTVSGEYRRIRDFFNEGGSISPTTILLGQEKGHVLELANYRAGMKAVVFRTELFRFYLLGSASTGSRAPLILELFGDRGAVIGNPDLVPERSETVEGGGGVLLFPDSLRLDSQVVFFRRRVSDMILFIPNSRFTLRAENLDAAEISGAEWSTRVTLFRRIRAHLNYTYQRAINRSEVSYLNGNYLPLRPLHEAEGGLSYFNSSLEVGGGAHYVGASFRDRSNEATGYVEARILYDLFFHFQFGDAVGGPGERQPMLRTWSFSLEIKNLLNQRVSDTNGYPLPGRSAYGSVSFAF